MTRLDRDIVAVAVAVAVVVLAVLLLVGCAPKVPPFAFAPVPDLPVAAEIAAEHGATDCPIAPLGKQPAGCTGLAVPPGLVEEYLLLGPEVDVWKTAAELQHLVALDSQARAEMVIEALREDVRVLRVENRGKTWAAFGFGTLGLIVGVAIGITAEVVAP